MPNLENNHMKNKKENSIERGLREACGFNSGMTVRDYYGVGGVGTNGDMPDHLKDFKEYIEVETGDSIFLVSFKWKSEAHRERAKKQKRRIRV